jgi:hypothetical protein
MMNWSGWSEVPGNGTTDVALSAACDGFDRPLYLVGKGINDQRIYLNTLTRSGNSDSWTGWAEVPPGGATTDTSPAAVTAALNLLIFVKGMDDHIYTNDNQQDWREVPGNGTTDVSVDATASDDLYLFAKGIDDQRIYVNRTSSVPGSPPWTGWSEVPGGETTDTGLAAAGGSPPLSIWLFRKGIDKRIYLNQFDLVSRVWSGWSEVPGGGTTDVALNALNQGAFIYLFAKGIDDQRIYVKVFNDIQHHWNNWQEVPGGGTTDVSLASAFGPDQNRLFLFSKGIQDRRIYVNIATIS